MKTSAIITVYNRPKLLLACLKALAQSTALVDEVVISDDGSVPENVEAVKSVLNTFPFPIRYLWVEDQGYRLSAARNHAIRHSAGDYLLLLDCDILLLPDALAIHLKHAKPGRFLAANRALADEAGTLQLMSRAWDETDLTNLWKTADKSHLIRCHKQFQRNARLRKFGLAKRHKPKILGCHFSFFREDVEKINGFDENYVGWGLEDDDFATRLHLARIRGKSLITDARAIHLWHPVVASYQPRLSESPNYAYFRRKRIDMFCEKGLRQNNS